MDTKQIGDLVKKALEAVPESVQHTDIAPVKRARPAKEPPPPPAPAPVEVLPPVVTAPLPAPTAPVMMPPPPPPPPTAMSLLEKLRFSPVEELVGMYRTGRTQVVLKDGQVVEVELSADQKIAICKELMPYVHSKIKPADSGATTNQSITLNIVKFGT